MLHAALDAQKQGYQGIVAVDARGGLSERTEQAALRQMEGAGVLISSVVSIATKLAPDFTTEKGKRCSLCCNTPFALVEKRGAVSLA